MAKPAPEAGHAADAKASHTTANTLPAYNTRRFAQEEPERLKLMPLPWANKEPDRPAPTELPRPQEPSKQLDIPGVGKLKEWKEVENAVRSIQKDLTHSDDPRHRPRRAEGGIDAEVLSPLIGDTILDTRAAQGKGGTIDWAKVTVQDWTTPTPNAAKHENIAERAKNFKDKEILYEWRHGVRDTSKCSNAVRVSSHHGGVYEHQKQVTEMLSKEKDYCDGPAVGYAVLNSRLPSHAPRVAAQRWSLRARSIALRSLPLAPPALPRPRQRWRSRGERKRRSSSARCFLGPRI